MKSVLISGATGKIGLAIARAFKKEGYGLALVYRSENKLSNLDEFKNDENVIFLRGDLKNFEECQKVVDAALEKFGKIDVLVNNAGMTKDKLLLRMKVEDFKDVIETNLYSVFYMSKLVLKSMLKNKYGKIINIASISGIVGNPGQCNYSASKAGVIAFTKSLSKEVARKNINVNALAPGFIESDMTKNLSKDEIVKSLPVGKLGSAEDVANAVLFLGSDKASYIHGKEIIVDGGAIWEE